MDGYSKRQVQESLSSVKDPYLRNVMRAAYHLRHFGLVYGCVLAAVIGLILLPTTAGSGSTSVSAGSTGGSPYAAGGGSGSATGSELGSSSSAAGGATGSSSGSASGSSGAGAGTTAAGQAPSGATGAGSSTATNGSPSSSSSGKAGGGQIGTGVTVGGVACSAGVRQLPYSQYADPCVSTFSGSNGGSTWPGVTSSTITIAIRHTADANGANAVATEAEVEAAGGQSYSVTEGYTQKLVAYFNKEFELYGRQVKLVDFDGQGNYSDEELEQDQAGACADADAIATSVHAFGVLDFEGNFETEPFAQCAARYKLYVPEGAPYFPESFYQSVTPYVWGLTMNCSLISQEFSEWAGKQFFPYPAQYAGNDGVTSLANAQRKLAIYIPNNAGYQDCASEQKQLFEEQDGVSSSRVDQYNYALDISTFPQDSQRAIIQFSADKDTSIELACDPISPIFLTQDAVQQNYYPEWVLEGVALTDSDSFAQLWDQHSIDGHLFGLSQAGSTSALLSPTGEAGRALTAAGVPINGSSVVDYYELLPMFNQLQAAGPDLTPANIAAGSASLPAGGSDTSPEGPWYFGTTHTLVRGSREIWWNGTATSPANNKTGTYEPIYSGQFFQLGQFPSGKPAFFQ